MSDFNRRNFLRIAAGGSLAALAANQLAAAPQRPPNIVYVFGDQHRNSSWWGGDDPQVITPNLARLAREGAAFNHCISTYPLCCPYRASLMTGRYPQATTIMSNNLGTVGLPLTEVTIADILKKAGYATGYVGKWHLHPGATTQPVPAGPHRHGFDWWRACQNYRQRYHTRCFDDAGKQFELQGYAPTVQMDMTIEFIEKNASKPFCVFLSWHPPHAPYPEAPQRFVDMYPLEKLKLRPNVPKDANLQIIREAYNGYFSHVTAMDEEMGKLMKKLDQLGIADNTIVVYTADHGDMLGSFNLWAKRKPWEESANVPFVIRWPAGIKPGQRPNPLFSTPDITPTLLALMGQPVPSRMQGMDMSPLLRGKSIREPESAFLLTQGIGGGDDDEVQPAGGARRGAAAKQAAKQGAKQAAKRGGRDVGEWRGVRTLRYTYARFQTPGGTPPWVLYDNEKDPYQLHNLANEASAAGLRKELDQLVDQWRKRLGEA